jgi:hypothetical protein
MREATDPRFVPHRHNPLPTQRQRETHTQANTDAFIDTHRHTHRDTHRERERRTNARSVFTYHGADLALGLQELDQILLMLGLGASKQTK